MLSASLNKTFPSFLPSFLPGKPRDAGILPRTLDVVFNSIDSQQCRAINHKPKRFMDVYKLSATEVEDEKAIKEKVLKMCTDDVRREWLERLVKCQLHTEKLVHTSWVTAHSKSSSQVMVDCTQQK